MIITDINFDFSLVDGQGATIALVGYLIVFLALVILFFVFKSIPKILKISQYRKLRRMGKEQCPLNDEITGELSAAISVAVFLHFDEKHDNESNVLTIRKISRRYSPWNVNKF